MEGEGLTLSDLFAARLLLATLAAAAIPALASPLGLPDPRLTPGIINPAVRQESLATTICKRGWTRTIRPSAIYTNKLKATQIAQYGYADTNPAHYQEDHLIPLGLGGHPRNPGNLWPQPRSADWHAYNKDRLEHALNRLVCSGAITLEDAQREIRENWVESYRKRVAGEAGKPSP